MTPLTRRDLLRDLVAAPGLRAQGTGPSNPVPRADLVNILEFEPEAARRLEPAVYRRIAGGDRAAFDRMTLRPRMMIPAVDLDLRLNLFGSPHFAPIVVGPVASQRQFHMEAEAATVKGASAAQAAVVVSSQSSVPFETLAGGATSALWFQVFASEEGAAGRIDRAVKAGCRVVCITLGAVPGADGRAVVSTPARDWDAAAALVRRAGVATILKGITTPDDARRAVRMGAQGIVVSNYGGLVGANKSATVLAVSAVTAAVAGKVPVLADGSFRRGTDILKALALGATAVMVARPVMWGLAAYGADGVQGVVEMLQTELGRYMAMSGAPTLKDINPGMVKLHGPTSTPQAPSPTPQASRPSGSPKPAAGGPK